MMARTARTQRTNATRQPRKARTRSGGTGQTEKLWLQKSYCTPSRHYLTAILSPYGIPFDAPAGDQYPKTEPGEPFPAYQQCEVIVPKQQAAWAEYLILSARYPGSSEHIFDVLSRPQNPKNRAWARARAGMPPPWCVTKFGKMPDGTCKQAKDAVDKAIEKASPAEAAELKRYFGKYQKGNPNGMTYASSKRKPSGKR